MSKSTKDYPQMVSFMPQPEGWGIMPPPYGHLRNNITPSPLRRGGEVRTSVHEYWVNDHKGAVLQKYWDNLSLHGDQKRL